MTSKRKDNLWGNDKLKRPVEQEGKPASHGDPFLEEELEEEVDEIDSLEQDVAQSLENHPTFKEMRLELITLKDELKLSREKLLRAHAEIENVRQRSVQDVEKAHHFGIEKFVKSLLPVVDSLEAALKNSVDGDPIVEGVQLTLKMFLDTLSKSGIQQIDPVNKKFDPQLHSAMSTRKDESVQPNTVLDVLQKGYELNGRLIRAALVVVSS